MFVCLSLILITSLVEQGNIFDIVLQGNNKLSNNLQDSSGLKESFWIL